jgi:homoserine kinase
LTSAARARARTTVRAPATSANLGSGFDCLGLALDIWNEVTLLPTTGTGVCVDGVHLSDPSENLIVAAANRACEAAGRELPPLNLRCLNGVPFSRGLGSSAAAIVCGLLVGNHAIGGTLTEEQLIQLATEIEGHPDNVVPAMLGGVRASVLGDGRVLQSAIPLAKSLHAVAFIPEERLSTERARAVLPPEVPFRDAVFNVGRASLLVAALASGRLELLREATRDRLQQPYRTLPRRPAPHRGRAGRLRAGSLHFRRRAHHPRSLRG